MLAWCNTFALVWGAPVWAAAISELAEHPFQIHMTPGNNPSEILWRIDAGPSYSYSDIALSRGYMNISLTAGRHALHMTGDWQGSEWSLRQKGQLVAGPFTPSLPSGCKIHGPEDEDAAETGAGYSAGDFFMKVIGIYTLPVTCHQWMNLGIYPCCMTWDAIPNVYITSGIIYTPEGFHGNSSLSQICPTVCESSNSNAQAVNFTAASVAGADRTVVVHDWTSLKFACENSIYAPTTVVLGTDFRMGVYTTQIDFTGKHLRIEGQKATLDAKHQGRFFFAGQYAVNGSSLEIHGLSFHNGRTTSSAPGGAMGGAIFAVKRSNLVIHTCLFESNSASVGGAVYAADSTKLVVGNSVFRNNTAAFYGGAIECRNGGSLIVSSSEFNFNRVPAFAQIEDGGAIEGIGLDKFEIWSSIFAENSAWGGGALRVFGGPLAVYTSTFVGNTAGNGGAMSVGMADIQISSCVFNNNLAWNGHILEANENVFNSIVIKNITFEGTDGSSLLYGRNEIVPSVPETGALFYLTEILILGSSQSSVADTLMYTSLVFQNCTYLELGNGTQNVRTTTYRYDGLSEVGPMLVFVGAGAELIFDKTSQLDASPWVIGTALPCSDNDNGLSRDTWGLLQGCADHAFSCTDAAYLHFLFGEDYSSSDLIDWFQSYCPVRCGVCSSVHTYASTVINSSSCASVWRNANCASIDFDGDGGPIDAFEQCHESAIARWGHIKQAVVCMCAAGSRRQNDESLAFGSWSRRDGFECQGGACQAKVKAINQLLCAPCSPGYYQAVADAVECNPCGVGKFQPAQGATTCIDCPVGNFAAASGTTSCTRCPQDYYQSKSGTTSCEKCMELALSLVENASSISSCKCLSGKYLCTDESECDVGRCLACPNGAVCGLGQTLQSLQTEKGQWRATKTTTVFHKCPDVASCSGGGISGSIDDQCYVGYVGLQCMVCDKENGYVAQGNRCLQCAKNEGRNSVMLVVASFIALALLIGANAKYRVLQRITASSKVRVTAGKYKGRLGTLSSKRSELEVERRYQVKLEDTHVVSLVLSGAELVLMRTDPQEEYQKRVMKIKLLVQFVTSCTRLSETYRVPFPTLSARFLSTLGFLELLDISSLPLQLGCWRYFDYVEKVYIHTLLVLGVMVLLKPRGLMRVLRILCQPIHGVFSRVAYTRFTICHKGFSNGMLVLLPSDYVKVKDGDALSFIDSKSFVCYIIKANNGSIQLAASAEDARAGITVRLIRKPSNRFEVQQPRATTNWLIKMTLFRKARQVFVSGSQKVHTAYAAARRLPMIRGEGAHSSLQQKQETALNPMPKETAALIIQRSWRCLNPRVLRAHHNIRALRNLLLPYVQKSKGLTTEDFFLLFTFAIYIGICDTCFLFFDCVEYEDGNVYLMADPSIQCTESYYRDSVWYVTLMSFLLPFGIPCYYSYALYRHRGVLDPRLNSVLKDKAYVEAFACSGVSFRGPDGKRLQGKALRQAKDSAVNEWKAANPAMHRSLEGKDYASLFQQKVEQAGFKKAKMWISIRARDANIPARRFKFLWCVATVGPPSFLCSHVFVIVVSLGALIGQECLHSKLSICSAASFSLVSQSSSRQSCLARLLSGFT
jgi:hypothetical protein